MPTYPKYLIATGFTRIEKKITTVFIRGTFSPSGISTLSAWIQTQFENVLRSNNSKIF